MIHLGLLPPSASSLCYNVEMSLPFMSLFPLTFLWETPEGQESQKVRVKRGTAQKAKSCLELFSWWGGCYPSWLSRKPISQLCPFLLQSQCTVECAVRFYMLSSPMNTLTRFLLKLIMSWGPCCELFTTGWCVWQQKTNVGMTQYTNVSLTWCCVLQ